MPFPPLQFHPVLKRIRWGGRRLGEVLGKPIGGESDYAESWEISCHEHGESVVAGGPYDGRPLSQLVAEFPREVLGRHAGPGRFPLLVKFLDAADRLSVQVHPNDEQAPNYRPGENGKTEAWVVLAAEPESRLYVGLKSGVTPERLRESLDAGTVESCLHAIPVAAGDCVFIPAGTVHAIGEGILLAEIQQSSDLTFRLYDWGRVGADGNPRELHIDDAIACTVFDRGPVDPVVTDSKAIDGGTRERLVACPYFTMTRFTSRNLVTIQTDDRFHVVMVLKGDAEMSSSDGRTTDVIQPLKTGETVLIPAACPDVRFSPTGDGEMILLEVHLP